MRVIKALFVLLHIFLGLALLVVTGAFWNPLAKRVKVVKRWWLGHIMKLMSVEVEVYGVKPEKESDKGIIFVSNHVSWLDIPLIGGLQQLNFLSKAEVKKWPLVGKLADGTGTLFIQRGSGDSHSMVRQIAERVNNGHSVLFFPEGTTTDGTSVKRFHPKLFRVACHTDAKFYPVIINYEVDGEPFNPVAFIDDDEFAEHLWHLLSFSHIKARVEFLPAVSLEPENLRNQVREMEDTMRRKVEARSRKIDLTTGKEAPSAASA